MKKTTTILCLGIALCMLGCSDDDDQVTTTSTVPFSLTASLSPRSSDAEDTGILQGNWDANSQLAVIKTGSSGVPKSILTRKTDSSDTFTGNLWLSGNFWLLSFKISYLCLPLFYETRTTPSCHPSGCAYRQL